MSKTCVKCNFTGPVSEFNYRTCLGCVRTAARKNQAKRKRYAQELKESEFVSRQCDACGEDTTFEDRFHANKCHACYVKQTRKARNANRKRRRQTLKSWFVGTECVICGLSDPLVLEFAHNDRSEKVAAVSTLAVDWSLSAARAEAEKCTVKCANCHCKETHDENASWRSLYMTHGEYPVVGERLQQKRFILDYLLSHSCVICGETDIRCLDFDHLEPISKAFGITDHPLRPVNQLKEEIRKCQVLCRNHHRSVNLA